MKQAATIISVVLIFISCSNVGTDKSKITKSNNMEDFSAFFEKFSSDSIFQKSRIKFPLSIVTNDIDANGDTTSTINADKWEFFNIKDLDKKHLIKITNRKDQTVVNVQIEDTGVFVDYIFQKLDNGKDPRSKHITE